MSSAGTCPISADRACHSPASMQERYGSDPGRRAFLATGLAVALGIVRDARAQSSAKVPRVGVLFSGARPRPGVNIPLEDGLRDLGYVPGKNIVVEFRAAEGRLELLPRLAAELAAMPVDVLVVLGPSPLRAALEAAPRTPIVMSASSSDPVGEGLVASLARPGGNLTGLTFAVSPERFGKQLELLKQAAPATTRVGVFWDLELSSFRRSWQGPLEIAARKLGVQMLSPTRVLEQSQVAGAIRMMKRDRTDAILVAIGGPTSAYREVVAAEAVRNRLPTIAAMKEFHAGRRAAELRSGFPCIAPACGAVRRPNSQGRATRGPADRAADQVRAGDQPQDRQGARPCAPQ